VPFIRSVHDSLPQQDGNPYINLSDTIVSKEIASHIIVTPMRLITYRDPRRGAPMIPVLLPIRNPVGRVDTKNGPRWMESDVPI
jgi:hypothetical protein